MGHSHRTFTMHPGWVTWHEVSVFGSPLPPPEEYAKVVPLVRQADVDAIVTHRLVLEEGRVKAALDDSLAGNAGKVAIAMQDGPGP